MNKLFTMIKYLPLRNETFTNAIQFGFMYKHYTFDAPLHEFVVNGAYTVPSGIHM